MCRHHGSTPESQKACYKRISQSITDHREREKERKREREKERKRECERDVPIERKLARVPAPRIFPKEPKSLLQANITIDHRSQITEREKETWQ